MLITSFGDSFTFSSSSLSFFKTSSGFFSACFKRFKLEERNLSLFLSFLEDFSISFTVSLNFSLSINDSGTEFPDSSPRVLHLLVDLFQYFFGGVLS